MARSMSYLGIQTRERPLIIHVAEGGHVFLGYGDLADEIAWCHDHAPKTRWKRRWVNHKLFSGDHAIVFNDEADAVAFRLRWC